MNTISEQINKLITIASQQQQIISADSLLVEDLGFDSLGLIDLTVLIEEKFNILIPASSIPNIFTVADLHDIVQNPCANSVISDQPSSMGNSTKSYHQGG